MNRICHLFQLIGALLLMSVFFVGSAVPSSAGVFSTLHNLFHSAPNITKLPADDAALEKWLKQHKQIENVKISRPPNRLTINFEINQKQGGQGALFDLSKACQDLGYSGRPGGLRVSCLTQPKKAQDFRHFGLSFPRDLENDKAITEWLKSQPAVNKVKVKRDGKLVVFEFESIDPPNPTILGDILRQCEKNGVRRPNGICFWLWALLRESKSFPATSPGRFGAGPGVGGEDLIQGGMGDDAMGVIHRATDGFSNLARS